MSFYYTDPATMNYMAKHHGMRLKGVEFADKYDRYYLDDLSIEKLGLQDGDVVEIIENNEVTGLGRVRNNGVETTLGPRGMFLDRSTCRVMQRNGMAFVWPKLG